MMAVEQEFDKVHELLLALEALVDEGAREKTRADKIERELFSLLLQLGNAFLVKFFENAGIGNEGETIERSNRTLKRLETKQRVYHSIFGVINVARLVYAERKKAKTFAPLDEQLGLPTNEHSYVLQDWMARFGVKNAFDECVASLRDLLGIRISKRTVEQVNEDIAEYVVPFRDSLPRDFDDDEELLVTSADGKGVPIRSTIEERNGLPETPNQRFHRKKQEAKTKERARRRLFAGQTKVRKQMAYVGAVFSMKRHVRTKEEILDANQSSAKPNNHPRPINKRVQATVTNYVDGERINGQELLFADLAQQVDERDPQSQKTRICIMDGQRSLWEQQRKHLPDAIPILDLFHAAERLWDAAYCFHAQGSREAEKFVERYYRLLLDGKVDTVLRSLRRKKHNLNGTKLVTLEKVIKYYRNNKQYMKYDEYLSNGYPIGSGVIEGTCRHLVKDRMERTGMRWEIEGAQAMLNTRSAYINNEWEDLIEFRIQKANQSNYGQAA